jgi:CheY-like chemotaxis protein
MATVLVVDDSQYTRRVHARILQSGGHEPVEAGSGAEALEAFALKRPAAVVLDLSMADMEGTEVLAKLQELDPDVRVVVVSANVQRSTETIVLEAGAVAFIGKPADPDELLAALDTALRSS